MKHFLTLSLALGSLAGAFEIPKGSYNLAQVEEASIKAALAKQPVAFVISNKKMTAT